MRDEWHEVVTGGGIHICTYLFEKFGPANALLLEYEKGHCAILSPPPKPNSAVVEFARSRGDIDALIISNIGHTAGYKDWQQIFPNAKLYTAQECIPFLNRLKPEDLFHPISEIPFQNGIVCYEAPGTRSGSVLVHSQLTERSVVFVDEILINIQKPIKPIFMRIMFAMTGTKTGLSVNHVYRLFLTKDDRKLRQFILELLQDDPVCIPAHGDLFRDPEMLQRARMLLK